jgi:hypothetical protein
LTYQTGYTTVEGRLVEFMVGFSTEFRRRGVDSRTGGGTVRLLNKYKAPVPRHYPILLTVVKSRNPDDKDQETFPFLLKIFRGSEVATWTSPLKHIKSRYRNNDPDFEHVVEANKNIPIVESRAAPATKLGLARALDEMAHQTANGPWQDAIRAPPPVRPAGGEGSP